MTQEDKELLLKDLCARLPYGVIVETSKGSGHICDINLTIFGTEVGVNINPTSRDKFNVEKCKPYLFPLSSMTEEQRKDFRDFVRPAVTKFLDSKDYNVPTICSMAGYSRGIEWCLKNHFDYKGLIPMKLAIDATNLNIY